MTEGRVRNTGGTLKSEYFVKDHQGNVRVSFEEQGGVAVVRQENSYYPFGLSLPGSTLPTAANRNLYNGGSEWQDDFGNLPDLQHTFYRMYDAALGRFLAVDPLAEASESFGTYHYALDNPVMYNDPLGDAAAMSTTDYINQLATMAGNRNVHFHNNGNGNWRMWDDETGESDTFFVGGYQGRFTDYMSNNGSGDDGVRRWNRGEVLYRVDEYGRTVPYSVNIIGGYDSREWLARLKAESAYIWRPLYYDALWKSFINNEPKSGEKATSAILGYMTLYLAPTESLLRFTAKTATSRYDMLRATKAANVVKNLGHGIGAIAAIATGIEGYYDGDGLTSGDFVKVGLSLFSTFGGPVGTVYGLLDLGVALTTGRSLTDRIGAGVDNMLK